MQTPTIDGTTQKREAQGPGSNPARSTIESARGVGLRGAWSVDRRLLAVAIRYVPRGDVGPLNVVEREPLRVVRLAIVEHPDRVTARKCSTCLRGDSSRSHSRSTSSGVAS